jgi:hypothetical protein
MEDESGGDAAEVTLNADASPFEAGLDKAAAGVNGWAGKVSARFDALSTSISAKTDKVAGLFASISEKAAAGIGTEEALGGMLGGALGAFAGPLGARIGAELGAGVGKAVGDNLDLESAIAGIGDFSTPIKGQLDDIREAGEGLAFTFRRTWDEVRDIVKALDISELVGGSLDDAEAKVTAFGAGLGAKIQGALEQTLARVADVISGAFDRVREPLARVADWVQSALRQFGLLSEGTGSWGDSIRAVQDVGVTVFAAVAKGLGTVFDVVMKGEAYISKYLIAPFVMVGSVVVEAMTQVAGTISKVLETIKTGLIGTFQIVKEIGGPGSKTAGRALDALHGWDVSEGRVKQQLDRAAKSLEGLAVKIDQHADEWIKAEIGATGDKWADAIRGGIGRGRVANELDDLFRAIGKELVAAVAGMPVEPEKPAAAPVGAASGRRAGALVAGSREAVTAAIADAARAPGGPKKPEERAAAGIEKMVGQLGGVKDEVRGLREDMRKKPGVEVEEVG